MLQPNCSSLPIIPKGPTKILPFLYLGSEKDAVDTETLEVSYFFRVVANYHLEFIGGVFFEAN